MFNGLLGVLLYELLAGETPFDKQTLKEAGFDEMRRIIREDEPPRPIARISTLHAEALSTLSEQRGSDPRKFSQTLRGELDWLVMKALEKDRDRRYESASQFAGDVQNYLDDEPVEACPPSVGYRLRKYARRHKGLLTTAGLLTATLLLATGVSLSYAFQADQARDDANQARDVADEEKDKAVAAQKLADERLEQSRLDLDRALEALDTVVEELSSPEFAQIPGVEKTRSETLQRMLALYEVIAKEHNDDPYARQQQALAYGRISDILRMTDQHERAEPAINQGILILDELLEDNPDDRSCKLRLSKLLAKRSNLAIRPRAAGLKDANRALALGEELVESGSNADIGWVGLLHLKVADLLPKDSPQIDEHIADAIRIPEEHGIAPHGNCYRLRASRAMLFVAMGERERAAADYDAFVERSKDRAWALQSRGEFYLHVMKDYEKALADFDEMLELAANQGHRYKRRALAHFHLSHFDEALADLKTSLERNPRALSTISWISPALVAKCPNQSFRSGMRALADRGVELNDGSSVSLAVRASLLVAFGEWPQARADLEAIVA